METKTHAGRHVPKDEDWGKFLDLLNETHQEINHFVDIQKAAFLLERQGWVKNMKTTFSNIDPASLGVFDEEVRSVAHHVADWYLQVSPWTVYRKPARQIVSHVFYIIQRLNQVISDGVVACIDAEVVATFGGYAHASSLASSAIRPVYDVLYQVGDIGLLVLNSTKLAKNWRKRTQSIFPGRNWKEVDL